MPASSRFRRRASLLAMAATCAGLLAGCTVQPLYGTKPEQGAVGSQLAAVTVAPVDDRIGQVLRNNLVFAFTGGAAAGDPLYELRFTTLVSEASLGVDPAGTAPSYAVRVLARFQLVELATGEVVSSGQALGVADYDRSNQAFATLRARQDAEDRAAISAADQIRLSVSVALARPS